MASSIDASTSGAGGVITTADNTGNLNIKSAGSTVLALTSSGTTVTGTGSYSGNLSFNSGYGSAAVAYGCRAWVNFDSTGTVAIRASGNVTSITDNGVGLYTVNLTTAMPDINYTIVGSSGTSAAGSYTAFVINADGVGVRVAPTTSAFRISTSNIVSVLYDSYDVNISVFR